MAQETKVSIGSSSGMTAKKATIAAEHNDTENVEMDSVSAGGVSGTGGETKVKVASDAGVSVGHGSTITTAEETAIRAENVTEKAWRDSSSKKNVSSIGAALASGNGVVNETSITHVTTVDLDAVTIKANASDLTVEEKAAGKTLYDKNAIAIDAASHVISKDRSTLSTGAAVGAAHVKNTNSVAATTTAHVREGSRLLAGETERRTRLLLTRGRPRARTAARIKADPSRSARKMMPSLSVIRWSMSTARRVMPVQRTGSLTRVWRTHRLLAARKRRRAIFPPWLDATAGARQAPSVPERTATS